MFSGLNQQHSLASQAHLADFGLQEALGPSGIYAGATFWTHVPYAYFAEMQDSLLRSTPSATQMSLRLTFVPEGMALRYEGPPSVYLRPYLRSTPVPSVHLRWPFGTGVYLRAYLRSDDSLGRSFVGPSAQLTHCESSSATLFLIVRWLSSPFCAWPVHVRALRALSFTSSARKSGLTVLCEAWWAFGPRLSK